MQPTTPLYQALAAHQKKGRASFHTPGHKGREGIFPPDLLSLDVTELPDTDSLFEAGGPILQAEQEAAQVLGTAPYLFFGWRLYVVYPGDASSGQPGQTAGQTENPGGKGPAPQCGAGDGSAGSGAGMGSPAAGCRAASGRPGTSGDVEAILRREGDSIAAVYVTSPDYFGVLADIPGLSAVCRRYDVPLLVDNAHGAHLFFYFPRLSPIAGRRRYDGLFGPQNLAGSYGRRVAEFSGREVRPVRPGCYGAVCVHQPVVFDFDLVGFMHPLGA